MRANRNEIAPVRRAMIIPPKAKTCSAIRKAIRTSLIAVLLSWISVFLSTPAWAVTPTVTAFNTLTGNTGTPRTFQVAVATGDTLYVGCMWDSSSVTITGITHNGDSMGSALATEVHSVTQISSALYRLLNPDVGTFDITVTWSGGGGDDSACVGLAIANVDQGTPETNTASNEAGAATSHTANIECPAGNLALDILGLSAAVTNLAPTGGQSERADETSATAHLGASTLNGAGTTTMSWSWTSSAQRTQVLTCIMGATASNPAGPLRRRGQ